MDIVLDLCDRLAFDRAYESEWMPAALRGLDRSSLLRQTCSMFTLVYVGIHLLYFFVAGGSYWLLFDKRMKKHPRYIKGQVWLEVGMSLRTFPTLTMLTIPWFVGEARGNARLYHGIDNSPFGQGNYKLGLLYMALSSAFFLWFTDFAIYWVHRVEHWPSMYKHIHKPHHRWVIPTPWASHAFHPLDGYAQSLPYHIFPYLFPLHGMTYLGLFVFVNLWTIGIHDSDMIVGHPLEHIINGPAHHTLHHMYFTCNFGQYFTWCDKMGGSYRHPNAADDPLNTVLSREAAREKYMQEKAELIKQEEAAAEPAVSTLHVYNSTPSGRTTPELVISGASDDGEGASSDDDAQSNTSRSPSVSSASEHEVATPMDDGRAGDYMSGKLGLTSTVQTSAAIKRRSMAAGLTTTQRNNAILQRRLK